MPCSKQGIPKKRPGQCSAYGISAIVCLSWGCPLAIQHQIITFRLPTSTTSLFISSVCCFHLSFYHRLLSSFTTLELDRTNIKRPLLRHLQIVTSCLCSPRFPQPLRFLRFIKEDSTSLELQRPFFDMVTAMLPRRHAVMSPRNWTPSPQFQNRILLLAPVADPLDFSTPAITHAGA
ncbi:hypothetical protein B0T13DRAFT_148062 [Neurospora crassa]|nr:hypothetical protein B0T13DRAFT_148062 [Neurospora crassa]